MDNANSWQSHWMPIASQKTQPVQPSPPKNPFCFPPPAPPLIQPRNGPIYSNPYMGGISAETNPQMSVFHPSRLGPPPQQRPTASFPMSWSQRKEWNRNRIQGEARRTRAAMEMRKRPATPVPQVSKKSKKKKKKNKGLANANSPICVTSTKRTPAAKIVDSPVIRSQTSLTKRIRGPFEPTRNFPLTNPKIIQEKKVQVFVDKLEFLLRVNSRKDVPKAAADVLYKLLEYGNDESLSKSLILEFREFISGTKSKNFEPGSIIRILWVIVYPFFPNYSGHVRTLKEQLRSEATPFFWTCFLKVMKVQDNKKDTTKLIREEMRCILKLWKELMDERSIQLILKRLSTATAYAWVLDDEHIMQSVRIKDFFEDKYLTKIEDKRNLVENSITEVSEAKSSDKETLKGNHPLESRKQQKRKVSEEPEPTNLFGEFHKLPSRPVVTQPSVGFRCVASSAPGPGPMPASQKLKKSVEESLVLPSQPWSLNVNSSEGQVSNVSKLDLFRKKMEGDEAIRSVSFTWNEHVSQPVVYTGKVGYLPVNWTTGDFVRNVFSEILSEWDIVEMPSGEWKVKLVKK